ncbi:ATP-NAD kinase-like domain-containing protein [Pseudoneurospora amorphoporcata]|uniref:ATP-NAD kinase-like domain-containing protein n=1 Tax=Pseudoneurospora amorphoporcata TaxID=241081 RepID=A0AAN6NT35_9PEZI|nr:ATP-NAD kinase-like domain-containing protein [Pseudoneurospora amorphoporcata]
MPFWLKNFVSLGRRRKGSTTARNNSQSDPKSTSHLKASSSDGHESTAESHSDGIVDERRKRQPQESLPRNTTTDSEEQPRDSVNMPTAATADKASSTSTPTPAPDHIHLNQRTGDLTQTSAHNGVGDMENSATPLNPNQIIFILKSDDTTGGYRIYSLLEEQPSPATVDDDDGDGDKTKVINGKADDDDDKSTKPSPFKLSVTDARNLPEELKRKFLVEKEKAPEHLAGVDEVHVIVSTRSGLGMAAGFYEGVLKRLLEEGCGFVAGEVGDDVVDRHGGHDGDKGQERRGGVDKKEGRRKYQITVTKSADAVKDFARGLVSSEGKQQPSRTIILLSGDGGIIDFLNGLDHPGHGHHTCSQQQPEASPSQTPTLAILPLGTGNALFHSLHKPLYTPDASGPSPLVLGLRTLFKRGVSAPLPTFRAEFSPGARLISGQPEVLSDNEDEGPKANLLFDVTTTNSTAETANGKEEEKKARPRPEITHLLGAIVFSYGFHASLVYESDTPAYRVHGDKRFGMAAGELLKLSHLYDASLSIRGTSSPAAAETWKELPRHTHSTYILATLVSNLEKTFCISPASRPLDGQLWLVHFGFPSPSSSEERGKTTMDIMMAAYRDGEHVKDPEQKFKGAVGYEQVEEIKVTIDETDERWRKVCVDGTIVEVEKGGWVSVRREDGDGSGKKKERLRVLVDEGVVLGRG